MRRRRLTERARAALTAACRLARDHSQAYIGTDALLCAMLQAAPRLAILEELPGRERLTREIVAALEAAPRSLCRGGLRLSPRAHEALEAAENEARALGAGATDLIHIVLGLLCAKHKGLAGLVLEQYGLEADELRSSLRRPRSRGGVAVGRHPRGVAAERRCPRCREPLRAWRAALGPRTLCRRCFGLDLRRGRARIAPDEGGARDLRLFFKN